MLPDCVQRSIQVVDAKLMVETGQTGVSVSLEFGFVDGVGAAPDGIVSCGSAARYRQAGGSDC
jgi:hypothetical protein